MIVYTEEELEVLLNMAKILGAEEQIRADFVGSKGTLVGGTFFVLPAVQEFLQADFKDVPKYMGASFRLLVQWRLRIGRLDV